MWISQCVHVCVRNIVIGFQFSCITKVNHYLTWNNILDNIIFPSIACFSMEKENSSIHFPTRDEKAYCSVWTRSHSGNISDNGLICDIATLNSILFWILLRMAIIWYNNIISDNAMKYMIIMKFPSKKQCT